MYLFHTFWHGTQNERNIPEVGTMYFRNLWISLHNPGNINISVWPIHFIIVWIPVMTRAYIILEDGYFDVNLENRPVVWTHVILNYVGLEKCMGIRTYENGRFTAADITKYRKTGYTPADGRLVVGRPYTVRDTSYASVKLDELFLFNATLSEEQIEDLSAHAWDCDTSGHSRFKEILLSSSIRLTQTKCIVIVKIKPDTSSFCNRTGCCFYQKTSILRITFGSTITYRFRTRSSVLAKHKTKGPPNPLHIRFYSQQWFELSCFSYFFQRKRKAPLRKYFSCPACPESWDREERKKVKNKTSRVFLDYWWIMLKINNDMELIIRK